jgi:hypothetical protein
MVIKARATAKPQRTEGASSYSREFLERLATVLVRSGHSPKALVREFRDVCSRMKEPTHPWDPKQLDYFADIPHVIAHWHADPQYLDSRGAPVPLPLRGRGPSLYELIERVLPGENPVAVAETLTRVKALRRRRELYVPRDRAFTYPSDSARIHGLTALLGMLRTVEHNVVGRGRSPTILERAAVNPSFPVSALPAFHRRLKALAAEFLWNVDGDMRRHEDRHSHRPRIRLGVGVFAFERPFRQSDQRRKIKPRKKAATRSRGKR